jgi:ABC-type branched-subunit amino acid transport system ATPase component
MSALLRVEGLAKHYRGIVALDAVSLEVRPGTITGLIGPNGSGKSTLFDCISGFQRHDAGRVWVGERELSGLSAVSIVRAGVRRTFQQLKVFGGLTVRDNILVAAQASAGHSAVAEVLRFPRTRRHESEMRERARQLLAELRLAPLADVPAEGLSYGQKKLLELAMALMSSPRLLLLDEPVAGINPAMIDELKQELLRMPARGVTVFIVEHNLKLVFDICDAIFVLDRGRILAAGTPDEIAKDERVIEAYLGK